MRYRTDVDVTDDFVKAVRDCPFTLKSISRWLNYGEAWLQLRLQKKTINEKAMRKICTNLLEKDPDEFIKAPDYDCCGKCKKRCMELACGDMVCCDRKNKNFGYPAPYSRKACDHFR